MAFWTREKERVVMTVKTVSGVMVWFCVLGALLSLCGCFHAEIGNMH